MLSSLLARIENYYAGVGPTVRFKSQRSSRINESQLSRKKNLTPAASRLDRNKGEKERLKTRVILFKNNNNDKNL